MYQFLTAFAFHFCINFNLRLTQPNPLRHKLLRKPAEVYEDGFMVVDDRPGIGVELDEDIVDKYRMA